MEVETENTQTTSKTAAEKKPWQAPFRKFDDNRSRGWKFLWEIWPDFWKKGWGDKPLLGTVRADSEFDAIRSAYDNNLLTYNFTFGPKPVKVDEENYERPKRTTRSYRS